MDNIRYIENQMEQYKVNNSLVIIPKKIKDNYEIIHISNKNVLKLNYNSNILNKKLSKEIEIYIKQIDDIIEFIILKNKKNLLTNISHEFNTSFNSIINSLDLIKNNNNSKIIEILYKSCIELNINLNNIIQYFFYKTKEFNTTNHKINTKEFFDDIRNYFNINKSILKIKYKSSPDYIYTDKSKLKEILLNLISNSIKFNSDLVYLNIYIKDNNIYFNLLDNGYGVKDTKKILESFYKENDYNKGLGLGLSNSKVLIEKLDGKIIEIKNNIINNQGLSIDFYIKNNDSIIQKDNIVLKDSKNILIVEDNVINSNLLKMMLLTRNKKIKINIINDSREVLNHLKKNSYDLIYLDLKMPNVSGFDIIDKLDKKYYNKVIIITALLNEKKVNILNNNKLVNQIIFKPIKMDDLK